MGDVVDLTVARARRRPGSERVSLPGAEVSWDAERRIVRLVHAPGVRLEQEQGAALGRLVLGWVGERPDAPYGLLVQGAEDQLGSVAYRRTVGRGAVRHKEHIRLVMFGGTPQARFQAETYLRGIGLPGAVVETERQALDWLAGQGIGL